MLSQQCAHRYPAWLLLTAGKLDGVVSEVDQYLTQAQGIAQNFFRNRWIDEQGEFHSFLCGQVFQQTASFLYHVRHIRGHAFDFQFASFYLREIEYVLDDVQQNKSRFPDEIDHLYLVATETGLPQHVGHADHTIHGSADLVAHGSEES